MCCIMICTCVFSLMFESFYFMTSLSAVFYSMVLYHAVIENNVLTYPFTSGICTRVTFMCTVHLRVAVKGNSRKGFNENILFCYNVNCAGIVLSLFSEVYVFILGKANEFAVIIQLQYLQHLYIPPWFQLVWVKQVWLTLEITPVLVLQWMPSQWVIQVLQELNHLLLDLLKNKLHL